MRQYFITDQRGAKQADVEAMIRRLQRMDVDVYQLRKGVSVPDFTPYGRHTREQWMPPGTWYVPMAQMQKHWVQAMLNEDTYTPFPYFYDVTAWSQPLLFDVNGGYSGKRLDVKRVAGRRAPDPGAPAPPADPPKIAVVQLAKNWSAAIESTGWLRYLLERVWHIPYTNVRASTVGNGKLDGYDVVLLPNGPSDVALDNLGDDGQQALQDWVNGGGHLISWRGGTEVAAELGLSTAGARATRPPMYRAALLRVRLNPDSPLHAGVGDEAYAFYEYDDVMRASSPDARRGLLPARRLVGLVHLRLRRRRRGARRDGRRRRRARGQRAGRPCSRSTRTTAPSRPGSRRSSATRCWAIRSPRAARRRPARRREPRSRTAPGSRPTG